ncbi:MAG: SDR family NAD(P)-dependent oxidoreductase [Acidimicrobiales bacterium]
MGLLDGMVAVVTGSSSGIGRSTAELFAAEGAALVVNSVRSVDAGRDLAASLPQAVYVRADVSMEEEARSLIDAAVERWGRVDMVVNSAGYADMVDHRDLEGLTDEIWTRNLRINLMSSWYVSRAAIPVMQRVGGGSITNITSLAGVHPTGSGSCIAYAVAKAGVNHLTVLLANAFGQDGIRVNALAVGPVETPMWNMDRNKTRSSVEANTLLGRPGQPEEIARYCLMMAAPGYATAQVVVVDGGMRYRVPR